MSAESWWRTAVTYQCYLRSFRDTDGDGVGDLGGLLAGLDHLVALGVDALWLNPCYPSPQADAGYDVADYRDVDPAYGTLEEMDALIAEAHARGLRILLDVVPNHTSEEHRWFLAAVAGDEAARARYLVRPGRAGGESPPNDWRSAFGGPAWSRFPAPDGSPTDAWYLHLFAPEQPDLDWTNPEVVAEFESVLRFWFDRGVDGFRIDVAHGLVKADGLPDAGERTGAVHAEPHPAWDQDGVHDVYRGWRRVADDYEEPRVFVAEAWLPDSNGLAAYLRSDELHSAFDFDLVRAPYDARVLRAVVTASLATAESAGAPAVWVTANHDVVRQVTRYGRPQAAGLLESADLRAGFATSTGATTDVGLGRRRLRAMLLLVLALPGSVYLYQGEELGLPEWEELPDERRQDPILTLRDGLDPGRDGCRVPLPWSGGEPAYGFSTTTRTWLPQPDDWGALTVAAQDGDAGSTLHLHREAIRLRRVLWRDAGDLVWVEESDDDVLALDRGDLRCLLNTGTDAVTLPAGEVLLASGDLEDGSLPPDTAVWLRRTPALEA